MSNIKNRTEGGKLKHHWIYDNALTVATVYGNVTGLLQISAYHAHATEVRALFPSVKEVTVCVLKGCKVNVEYFKE